MSPLSPEHNFILAIAAKAAVLNAPLPDSDLFAWWQPLGMIWLNTLCERVRGALRHSCSDDDLTNCAESVASTLARLRSTGIAYPIPLRSMMLEDLRLRYPMLSIRT